MDAGAESIAPAADPPAVSAEEGPPDFAVEYGYDGAGHSFYEKRLKSNLDEIADLAAKYSEDSTEALVGEVVGRLSDVDGASRAFPIINEEACRCVTCGATRIGAEDPDDGTPPPERKVVAALLATRDLFVGRCLECQMTLEAAMGKEKKDSFWIVPKGSLEPTLGNSPSGSKDYERGRNFVSVRVRAIITFAS